MRKTFASFLNKEDYLLHADMFNTKKFPTKAKVINCGLGESNLLNIAGGLASQGKNVFIYGVAGFIIHRLEQLKLSCKYFGAKFGKITILNAWKIGYDNLGIGHQCPEDIEIMISLNILSYDHSSDNNLDNFKITLNDINKISNGICYIRLGKDFKYETTNNK